MMKWRVSMMLAVGTVVVLVAASGSAWAGAARVSAQAQTQGPPASTTPGPDQAPVPSDYVIGPEDVLQVSFRREPDMSAEVVVRPDGKVTLQLLGDMQAAGLTPVQLRDAVTKAAERFIQEPSVTVVVRQINSRRVFITGQVAHPGAFPLGGRMTVVQLIALAGGLTDYAKPKEIVIIRSSPAGSGGRSQTFRFNYDEFQKLKNLESNIDLKPGDTVIVPGS